MSGRGVPPVGWIVRILSGAIVFLLPFPDFQLPFLVFLLPVAIAIAALAVPTGSTLPRRA